LIANVGKSEKKREIFCKFEESKVSLRSPRETSDISRLWSYLPVRRFVWLHTHISHQNVRTHVYRDKEGRRSQSFRHPLRFIMLF